MESTTSQDLPARVRLAPDVLVQVLDDEAVLLDVGSERYYGLNAVGTRVWQLLAQDADVSTVYRQLLAEFRVDPETLRRDLAALLQDLTRAKLVIVE